jgi:hypothetical protein
VTVYEYNGVNTGTTPTAAYLLSGAPTGNVTTLAPSISVSPSSLSGFSTALGTTSAEQSYTVSGTDLFANLTVTAPTNYQVSATSGGPYTSSVSLTPVSNVVPATTIYVVLSPSGTPGTKSGNITNASTGATSQNVAVTGTALAVPPSTPASGITFSNLTNTAVKVSWTNGDGSGRIVIMNQGSAPTWTPTNYAAVSGVSSVYTTATDQGGGKIVYNGTASSISVTGLISGQTYYVTVYEYNGVNTGATPSASYLLSGAPTGNVTTLVPVISVSPSSLSGFSTALGTTSAEQSYTVSGTDLFANLTVTAPTNYQVSTTSGGPYTSSVSLTPVSNVVSATTIYVVLSPSGTPGTKSGNITNASTGATSQNVAVTGTALAVPPTTAASNLIFSNVTLTSAKVSWTNGNGTGRLVVMNQGSAPTWTPTDFTAVSGVSANYSMAADQSGGVGRIVYNGTASSVNVSGLTSGQTYYVTIYEYNGVNTGSTPTAAYLISGAPSDFFTTTNPVITVSPTSLSGFTALVGSNSSNQTYTVSATGLFDTLFITAPTYYQVSSSSTGPFSTSMYLIPSGGIVSATTIYVRFAPSIPGNLSGNVSNLSSGATTKNVSVSGTATAPAYVWTGSTNLDWQNASNWFPNRTVIQPSDTLKFTSTPAGTITNVPNETIKKLIIQGPSNVDLQAASSGNTITLNVPAATDNALVITSGSVLTISGSNILNISIASSSSANVLGNIVLTGANHTLGGAGVWVFGPISTVSYTGGGNQTVSNLNYNDLSLSGSDVITLPSSTLSLNGSFINNNTGTVNHNNGTVNFNGGGESIGGSSITDFNNISLASNASVALGNSENLIGALTLGTGSAFTTTGYTFTLVSTPTETARIDVIPTGASIVGNIKVERYIPGSSGRYWYHLASPVTGGTFTQLKTNATTLPPNPDNGIFITGTGIANTTADIPSIGITNTTVASVYSYNAAATTSSASWVAPTDLANAIPSKVGYRFFIRDGSSTIAPTTGAKYLSLTGAPNTGNQSYALKYSSVSGGYNFLGNPYPSDISADLSNSGWNTSSANLTNHTVYIWNSDASAYVSCLDGAPSTSGACTIPSFQGFWVVANSGGGTLTSNENVKVSGSSVIFKKSNPFQLPITITNKATGISHGSLIRFDDNSSSGLDDLDAVQMFDNSEDAPAPFISVCTNLNNIDFAINTVTPDFKEFIKLNTVAPIGTNKLDFSGMNIPNGSNPYLIDDFLNVKIDLLNQKSYEFTVDGNEKSIINRFKISFSNSNNVTGEEINGTMSIYPNPSKGKISVTINNSNIGNSTLYVYDAYGKLVVKENGNSNTIDNTIDLSNCMKGMYTVVCVAENGKVYSQKVVVE